MKYGDFSSLVQLGVGLHIGTALLQLYGELGVQPLVRTITRLNILFAEQGEVSDELHEDFSKLEADFDIFKIKLFNEYKKYIKINSAAACFLAILLVAISYKTEDAITVELSIFVVALSVLPAPLTLATLWIDANTEVRPIKERADKIESRVFRHTESEASGVYAK